MKLLYAPFLINIFLIVAFGFIYWYFCDEFISKFEQTTDKANLLDFFYTSITIQAGIGYLGIIPISVLGKVLLMLQQICMISSNIIIIYLVHLHFFVL